MKERRNETKKSRELMKCISNISWVPGEAEGSEGKRRWAEKRRQVLLTSAIDAEQMKNFQE